MGVTAKVDNIEGTWQEITYGIPHGLSPDPNRADANLCRKQRKRQYHGDELDVASASIRSDLCRRDRRRLQFFRHRRSEWGDGFAQDQDQQDGLFAARLAAEEHDGEGSGRARKQVQVRVPGEHVSRNSYSYERVRLLHSRSVESPLMTILLHSIIGLTGVTLETDLTRQQRENLMIVSNLANSLLLIIDDILDISKIEAGRMTVESIPFSARSAVFGILKTLAVKATQSRLDLMYSVESDIPDLLVGDPFRLRQVITNLVGNAIKVRYTVFPSLWHLLTCDLVLSVYTTRASRAVVPTPSCRPRREDVPARILHQ